MAGDVAERGRVNGWYLFDASATPLGKQTLEHAGNIFLTGIRRKYIVTETGMFDISIGIHNFLFDPGYAYVVKDPVREYRFDLPYRTFAPSISMAYTFYTKDTRSYLSYLKVRLSASYSAFEGTVLSSDNMRYVPLDERYGFHGYTFPVNWPFECSTSRVMLVFSTPLVVFQDYFSIDPTLSVGFSQFSYSGTVSYEYQWDTGFPNPPPPVTRTVTTDVRHTESLIGPGVECVARIWGGAILTLGVGARHYWVMIGAHL